MTVQLVGEGPEIGIVVRDPEVMLAFYRDFLGLEVDREMEFPGIRLWWLRCGGGFVKLAHPASPPDVANPPGQATGLRYLTLVVDNVEEVADAVEAAGGKMLHSSKLEQLTMAMFEDPEGNRVELVRWH
jgi:catechol 2,3-dioxygenase-like lactoylglutathione lyase family enzyme